MPELFKAKCSQVMFPLLNALQQDLKEGKYVTLFFASVCSNTLMLWKTVHNVQRCGWNRLTMFYCYCTRTCHQRLLSDCNVAPNNWLLSDISSAWLSVAVSSWRVSNWFSSWTAFDSVLFYLNSNNSYLKFVVFMCRPVSCLNTGPYSTTWSKVFLLFSNVHFPHNY